MNREVRIAVRSGAVPTSQVSSRPIKVICVSGGRSPMVWLGGARGEYDGLAWVSGRETLRRLRDAIDEVLGAEGGGT